jgi:hypothetical protein
MPGASLKMPNGNSRARQTDKQVTDTGRGRDGVTVRLNNQEQHNCQHNRNNHEIEGIHYFLIQGFSMHGFISFFEEFEPVLENTIL